MSEQFDGQNAAIFLGQRHGKQFRRLSEITDNATDILDPIALTPDASGKDRRADAALIAEMNEQLTHVVAGPLSAENALVDWNGKRAPVPSGSKTIKADTGAAPEYTPAEAFGYIPRYLAADAASNAVEYLRTERHREFMDIATGRYSHYYAGLSRINLADSRSNYMHILVPIGEYGAEPALDLLRATYHAMVGATPDQLDKLDALAKQGDNRQLILDHTTFGRKERAAYGRDLIHTRPLGMALSRSVFEGDLSIQQTVSLLAAEKIDGFETMASLWQAIRKAKLVEKITRLLPFGNLAPATEMNAFIPGLVEQAGDNEVRLNPEIEGRLKDYKAEIQSDLMEYFKKHPEAATVNDMGIFCPALAHNGGLTKRHDVVYKRFETLHVPQSRLRRISRW